MLIEVTLWRVKDADYDKSPWTKTLAAVDYRATNYGNYSFQKPTPRYFVVAQKADSYRNVLRIFAVNVINCLANFLMF